MMPSTHEAGKKTLEALSHQSVKFVRSFVHATFNDVHQLSKAFTESEESTRALSTTLARKILQHQDTYLTEMIHAVSHGFEKLVNPAEANKKQRRLGIKNLSISLDELSLVDHDELQKQLVVTQTSNYLHSNYHDLLGEINMRIEEVLKLEIPLNKNPLHPNNICHAILQGVGKFGLKEDEALLSIKYLLKAAASSYPGLLDSFNILLSEQGVLPKLDKDAIQYRYEEEMRVLASKEKRLATLQNFADRDHPEHPVSESDIEAGLSTLLKSASADEELERHVIKSGKQAILLHDEEFLSRLKQLSKLPDLTNAQAGYPKVEEEPPTLSEKIKSVIGTANFYFTDRTTNTVSMLSMLFDQMNEDNNLAPQIKHLIHFLQAPMLRAAILDHMFFSDTENPAQRLLDSLATAGATWTQSENRQRDSLYNKMAAIVVRINKEFDDDYTLFADCQKDLDLFTRAEKRRARLIEERMVAAEYAKARTDRARLTAARHVARLLKSSQAQSGKLPKALVNFFSTVWNQALFFIHNLHESTETTPWKNAIDIEQRLITQLDTSDDKSLDALLKDVETLLKTIGTPSKEIENWVDALSQSYCLESNTEVVEAIVLTVPPPAQPATEQSLPEQAPSEQPTPEEHSPQLSPEKVADKTEEKPAAQQSVSLAADASASGAEILGALEKDIEAFAEAELAIEAEIAYLADDELPDTSDVADEYETVAANLTPNAWVQSHQDGQVSKVRVAAIIKHSDKVVLVNRNGSRAATLSRKELAQRLRSGEMTVIENGMFFDRALETVIQNLRK
ncbi:MAG: DUF1631 family protein [Hahellaceae bacterium]|nr:DUF1631 family protein [Hahellaceae bacterium]